MGRIARARGTTDFDDLFAHAAAPRAPASAGAARGERAERSPSLAARRPEPMQVVRYDRRRHAHYDNKQGACVARRSMTCAASSRRRDAFKRPAGKGGDADGVRVWPKRGRALVFWSVRGGVEDVRSLHEAEPVAAGEKWIATKWMQVAEERPASG